MLSRSKPLSTAPQLLRSLHTSCVQSQQATPDDAASASTYTQEIVKNSTKRAYNPIKPEEEKYDVLSYQRSKRLIFKTDREILEHSVYPSEYPSTEIPVSITEIPVSKGRNILKIFYEHFKEFYNGHRNIVWFNKTDPRAGFSAGVWIAPSATVIGDVMLGEQVNVWYGAVIRADLNSITIGHKSNIQDGVVITTDDKPNENTGIIEGTYIGNNVTVGHGAKIHACRIEDNCLIGMNATILEGSIIDTNCVIAAGSVVAPYTHVHSGELWAGVPARFIRKLTEKETDEMQTSAIHYSELAEQHRDEFTMVGTQWRETDALVNHIEEKAVDSDTRPVYWNVWKKQGQEVGKSYFPGGAAERDFHKDQ